MPSFGTVPPILLCRVAMAYPDARRACRHEVRWPARVRSVDEVEWHTGQVVNLSVTGVLLRMDHQYRIGERVEVEIDFLTKPECKNGRLGSRIHRPQRREDPRQRGCAISVSSAVSRAAAWKRDSRKAAVDYRASRARRASLNDLIAKRDIGNQQQAHHQLREDRGTRELSSPVRAGTRRTSVPNSPIKRDRHCRVHGVLTRRRVVRDKRQDDEDRAEKRRDQRRHARPAGAEIAEESEKNQNDSKITSC